MPKEEFEKAFAEHEDTGLGQLLVDAGYKPEAPEYVAPVVAYQSSETVTLMQPDVRSVVFDELHCLECGHHGPWVTHAAYESLERERDEWRTKALDVETHPVVVALQRELADAVEMFKRVNESAHAREVIALEERSQARAELERVKGVCADLNRQNNTTFAQSCKNYEDLNKERARNAGLVEALLPVAECGNCGGCRDNAREALAKYGGEK